MIFMMLISYVTTAFLDLKATYQKTDKVGLAIYFILMAVSCTIGISSGYVQNMPSPAEPIKQFIFFLLGKS